MTQAIQKPLTLEEFLRLPQIEESPAWEYVNGEVIQKPMGGGKHSTLQKRLISAIDGAQSVYEAFPELRCTPGPGRSVVPDVAVIERARIPVDENGDISSTGIFFAPDWIIEILSPNQSQTKVTGNIIYCIKNGTQLGWLIDPDERSVLIYQPNSLPDLLQEDTQLPALPGMNLELTVEQLFIWMRRG